MPSLDTYQRVRETNLSLAWLKVLNHIVAPGNGEIMPLAVTIPGLANDNPTEFRLLRDRLDGCLREDGHRLIDTTANTIFPYSLWNRSLPRSELYARYLRLLPRVRAAARQANSHGTYFGRMISFGRAADSTNQLEHVIDTWSRGNHRRSALQIALLDPQQDLTHQRQRGFPCLQQIAFTPLDGQLHVTAFYATQDVYRRAYGNYVGLCRLGLFAAHGMGLQLESVTCMAAVAVRGAPIMRLSALATELAQMVDAYA